MGRVQHDENKKSKQSNYLLNRKNGMQTVAMVMPKDLKKWSDGISVIPNTDLVSTLANTFMCSNFWLLKAKKTDRHES